MWYDGPHQILREPMETTDGLIALLKDLVRSQDRTRSRADLIVLGHSRDTIRWAKEMEYVCGSKFIELTEIGENWLQDND